MIRVYPRISIENWSKRTAPIHPSIYDAVVAVHHRVQHRVYGMIAIRVADRVYDSVNDRVYDTVHSVIFSNSL